MLLHEAGLDGLELIALRQTYVAARNRQHDCLHVHHICMYLNVLNLVYYNYHLKVVCVSR